MQCNVVRCSAVLTVTFSSGVCSEVKSCTVKSCTVQSGAVQCYYMHSGAVQCSCVRSICPCSAPDQATLGLRLRSVRIDPGLATCQMSLAPAGQPSAPKCAQVRCAVRCGCLAGLAGAAEFGRVLALGGLEGWRGGGLEGSQLSLRTS